MYCGLLKYSFGSSHIFGKNIQSPSSEKSLCQNSEIESTNP
jgi:hypothetical protein